MSLLPRRPRHPARIALLALVAGCASAPPAPRSGGFPLVEKHRFRLFAKGRLIGYLRDLEIQHPVEKVRFYRVETPTGGWVGNVDAVGRFYKCEPFLDEPRLLGMFAWDPGLQRLFESAAPIRILPMRGQDQPAEASARRLLREARAAHLRRADDR